MNQDEGIMARFEQEAHSFVIRVWQENRDDVTDTAVWRGWVDHIPSGQRHYFQEVEHLIEIMTVYLKEVPELHTLLAKFNDA